MKIVFGILLFTFVILLNSIEVSSQSSNGGGRGGPRPGLHLSNVIPYVEFGNTPAGHIYVLPNGNLYRSTGTGRIRMDFDMAQNTVRIQQAGSPTVVLGPGPYSPSNFRAGRNLSVFQVQSDFRPPSPRPPGGQH